LKSGNVFEQALKFDDIRLRKMTLVFGHPQQAHGGLQEGNGFGISRIRHEHPLYDIDEIRESR
jgi:hypothetical protein